MKDVKQSNGHIVPPRHRKRTCKQKRLLRLGCTALALTLVMVTGIMTGILPGIGMTAYASPAAYTITWGYETFRTLPSGGTQNGITFSGDKSDYSTNVYSSQITFTLYDEPPHEHTWEWVTDIEPNCGQPGEMHEKCTVCGATQSEGTVIDPTGAHDWAWMTDTEPTETHPGEQHEECTVCGAKQNEHTVIPARGADNYAFTDDSAFKWKKGSKDGLLMVIKNTSNPAADPATFEKLVAVYVDGNKLNPDTDYTAVSGSIRLTLLPGYLNKLSTGEHTLKVVLTVTTIKHTFTVTAPASTDAPSTGENGLTIAVSFVLLACALAGCAFSFLRKRKAQT